MLARKQAFLSQIYWQSICRALILMHHYSHRQSAWRRMMRHVKTCLSASLTFLLAVAAFAADTTSLSSYFPPPEDKGGWRTLLPESGEPSAQQKAEIRKQTGC